MHELSIATALFDLCQEHRLRHRAGPMQRVNVTVGELSSVEPDLLVRAWEALVAGSQDDGARLIIEWSPARQVCTRCGEVADRQPGSWLRLCPDCSLPLRVEGGRELDLMKIEFLDEPEEPEAVVTEPSAASRRRGGP